MCDPVNYLPKPYQQAKLSADDGDEGDVFGSSVALSDDGTIALIGAPGDEDPNARSAGSAYVFESSDGSWSQAAKLTADDGDKSDRFGSSVALSDDGVTAFIGAYDDEDPNGDSAGSAYVFESSGRTWSQAAKLTSKDGDSYDLFGKAVAISADGTTAVIAAPSDEDPNGERTGSAYVFESSEGIWNQIRKLTPDDPDRGDMFGNSVTMSRDGTTAVIGASDDSDPNGPAAGSAYVFELSGDSWSQAAKLAADDGDKGDGFGWAVAVSDDGATAIIGAGQDEGDAKYAKGSAYVFEASNDSWSQQAKLTADGDIGDEFGKSVAVSGDGLTAIIGAQGDGDPNGKSAGSAYVFEL